MEVLYYVREQEGIQIQDYLRTERFFIPEKEILFTRESINKIELYKIVNKQYFLEEAKALAKRKDPYENKRSPDVISTTTFSDIEKNLSVD